jgi:5-methylcytosine-specific restriction endonuclease McrA
LVLKEIFGNLYCEDCGNQVIPYHIWIENQFNYIRRDLGECWICGRIFKIKEN